MRAFSKDRDDGPADAGEEVVEEGAKRVVSLKKRSRGDDTTTNGDAGEDVEPRKKGVVRGRGAATYQSAVAAVVDDGPRREPPAAEPSRVLKVSPTYPILYFDGCAACMRAAIEAYAEYNRGRHTANA
jgi:hypothetical protein